ncbi:MAG: UDP-N-acetylglucosamine pyrophosphorylase [Oscillospiraceae bacterium]
MKSELEISKLYNIEKTIAKDLLSSFEYPWEVLPNINNFIKELGKTLSPLEYDNIGNDVYISKTAKVANSASITGPCIIDHNTEIRHCAFIRGSVIVGKNCVVGNSVELKNVILFDNVQVPHYNYVGDSILGNFSHLGAGSLTSNVKSDKTLVSIRANNKIIETGLKKFGAMVGDFVEVGCNSVLCPGTVIGKGSRIYPVVRVRGYIPANSIVKSSSVIIKQI